VTNYKKKLKRKNEEKDEKEANEVNQASEENQGPLEEVLEKMRAKLDGRTDLTPCNDYNFYQWIAKFKKERELKEQEEIKKNH